MEKKEMHLKTIEQIKAYSDPYRFKILLKFSEIGEPATVKMIADAMGEVPAKVHYHIKKLEKAGIVKLVKTQEIKGIIAKYYEPTATSFIIRDEKLADATAKVYLSEVKKIVHECYAKAEDVALTSVDKLIKNDDNEDINQSQDMVIKGKCLCLTEEEFKEFSEYVGNFFDKHAKRKKTDKDKIKFNAFFSIIKDIEDEEK